MISNLCLTRTGNSTSLLRALPWLWCWLGAAAALASENAQTDPARPNKEFLYIRNFAPHEWPTGEVDGHNPKYDFAAEPWPTEELYDLSEDPDQLHNVAGNADYAQAQQQLRQQLDAELIKSQDPRMAVKIRNPPKSVQVDTPELADETEPGEASEFSPPGDRPRVVVVKPVILCDDDGGTPARHALPKTLVDRVYTKAGLEFVYLEPIRWHHGKARRGEINLDQIVRDGFESRTISRDRRVVTLLFVSAVDGHPGPLGRGRQNGNVCFVALGPADAMTDPAERAFVVAHEIGHCLNLKHAVNDPDVPDDAPNLQGEGEFEERLAVAGLHDAQRDTVLCSPLVLDRIRFHNLEEGRRLIADESWEPYLSNATDDMLRFSIGLKADTPIPQNAETRKTFAQQKYAEKVLEFTEGEKKLISRLVERLGSLLNEDWPCVGRLPWHFIKVDSSFCKGMAHTRGLAIILPQRYLRRIAGNEQYGMKLLLHEKMHVVQRLNGPRFESLYKDYGFQKITLADGELHRINVAQNPDGFQLEWGLRLGDSPTMLVTLLAPGDNGDFRFLTEYRTLLSQPDGTFAMGPSGDENGEFHNWRDSFPLNVGHDHPNEISAYLSGILFDRDFLRTDKQTFNKAHMKRIDQTRRTFRKALRLDGE